LAQFIQSKQMADHGKTVEGVVWSGDDGSGKKSGGGYHLAIKFTTDDQQVREERIKVTQSQFTELAVGQNIKVHYLPQDPHVCQIGDDVRLQFGSLFRACLFFGVAVYGLLASPRRRPEIVDLAAKNINKTFQTLTLE